MTQKEEMKIGLILYFDGLCEPKNPGGVATYGLVILQNGLPIHEENGLADAEPWSKEASNNVAEYSALIRGLEWLRKKGLSDSPVIIRGDSRLIINQLTGKFKVKALRLLELNQRAKKLLREFKNSKLEWVERESNKEADLLSRIAFAKYMREHSTERQS